MMSLPKLKDVELAEKKPVGFMLILTLTVLFVVVPAMWFIIRGLFQSSLEDKDKVITVQAAQLAQEKRERAVSDSVWQVRYQTQFSFFQSRIEVKDSLIIVLSMVKGAEIANQIKNKQ